MAKAAVEEILEAERAAARIIETAREDAKNKVEQAKTDAREGAVSLKKELDADFRKQTEEYEKAVRLKENEERQKADKELRAIEQTLSAKLAAAEKAVYEAFAG